MKKLLYLPLLIFAFSCNKKEESAPTSKVDSTAIIDSINTARTKINDSIRSTNHFQTFQTKDGGKTWKLQDKPNPSGFVDNIIIYF